MTLKNDLPYGWFDNPNDKKPAFTPRRVCLVCMKPYTENELLNIQTICLMQKEGAIRSYFFRVHKNCWGNCTDFEKQAYESGFIDNPGLIQEKEITHDSK